MKTQHNTSEDSRYEMTFNRWFTTAITVYVIIEAGCIAVLMYLWLSN